MGRNCGIAVLLFWVVVSQAQIQRVEPPNWWVGMQQDTLQLLVHGENIAVLTPSVLPCQDCPYIREFHLGDSPNYLFIDLVIPPSTLTTQFPILLSDKAGKQIQFQYELKQRLKKPEKYLGFNSSDALYLITPDRFANGDPNNDSNTTLLETEVNRTHDYKGTVGILRESQSTWIISQLWDLPRFGPVLCFLMICRNSPITATLLPIFIKLIHDSVLWMSTLNFRKMPPKKE